MPSRKYEGLGEKVKGEEMLLATDLWWVEARDASKHPTMHRTAPRTKKYPAQNVNSITLKVPGLESQQVH